MRSLLRKIIPTAIIMAILITTVLANSVTYAASDSFTSILNDGTLVEVESYVEEGVITTLERRTSTSGQTTISVTQNGITETTVSDIDYAVLKESIENANNQAQLRAVDIHGSNFRHTLLATNSCTITRAETQLNATIIATILGTRLNLKLSHCLGLGRVITSILTQNAKIYSVKVQEQIYEVYFAYENIYYTHCYHETVYNYDSGGHLLSSSSYQYESIGG